jgi:Family of unknown function (DUF6314)
VYQSADLITLLAGCWSIQRRLLDRRHEQEGEFTGIARFSREGGGLCWAEEGRMRLGAFEGPASRRLLIRRDPSRWTVMFEDRRPFHPLDLSSGACAVEHQCGLDHYAGEYSMPGLHTLEVVWDVRGPRKHQGIRSTYRRVEGRGA